MHIPDGYLSPQTYLPLYGLFVSFIAIAIRKVKSMLSVKLIPFLGMASAFSFLIMMFNIPIPGGTTGHAVGTALISLVLGPWVAIVSVSVALVLQALIFGDGGITAIGANCLNMAVAMPFVAYWVFKIVNGKARNSLRTGIAAFLSGYISLCLAAVLTAFELGIQPLIASTAEGQPLYSPYPLSVALPVMTVEHLLLFGVVEGLVTALLFRYLCNANSNLIEVFKK